MRKLIASINMSLDGFCNHDAFNPDEELLQDFNELFSEADTIVFGRVTYQLMENSWPQIVKRPTGIKAFDEFAVLIDNISKIVFSNTLNNVYWKNTRLATRDLKEEVIYLKQQSGKNILVGGPGLIATFSEPCIIDEYRLYIHPAVLGNGLPLFKNISERINLKLIKSKVLGSGVVALNYVPVKE
jgi:dihydrofolate reductase